MNLSRKQNRVVSRFPLPPQDRGAFLTNERRSSGCAIEKESCSSDVEPQALFGGLGPLLAELVPAQDEW